MGTRTKAAMAALAAGVALGVPLALLPTTTASAATTTVCSGTNAVETAYVARSPGFIVVNGGLDVLDHLWTTNLNPTNTTFEGGLVNWFQTGLVLSYTGTTDPYGCILDHLTVTPRVAVATTTLSTATAGVAYQAPVAAAWGASPTTLDVAGLPAGLSFDGAAIVGTPAVAGSSLVTVTAVDANGATASTQLTLVVAPAPVAYTVKVEGRGRVTAVDPNGTFVVVGGTRVLIDATTAVEVHAPKGSPAGLAGVKVGMKAQYRGLKDVSSGDVLAARLEIG